MLTEWRKHHRFCHEMQKWNSHKNSTSSEVVITKTQAHNNSKLRQHCNSNNVKHNTQVISASSRLNVSIDTKCK